MITVKERTPDACEKTRELCEKYGVNTRAARFFLLEDGEIIGLGVIRLKGAKVVIDGAYGQLDESYRDLLCRSLLNVCADMEPITLRVDSLDPYWRSFGFTEADGGLEILNTNIKFCNH